MIPSAITIGIRLPNGWFIPRLMTFGSFMAIAAIALGTDKYNIALSLDLSVKTVENHLTALYGVLGVDSRLKASNYALRHPEILASSGNEMTEAKPFQFEHNITILIIDDTAGYRQQLKGIIGKV